MPDNSGNRTYPLIMGSGIQKDGTEFSGRSWVNGNWCRFIRKAPAKIGGYASILNTNEQVRGMKIIPKGNLFHIFYGTVSGCFHLILNSNRNIISNYNVTPVGFVGNNDIMWQFEVIFANNVESGSDGVPMVIAYAGNNFSNISNEINSPIYWILIENGAPNFQRFENDQQVSGGIAYIGSYLFAYGNYGVKFGTVKWNSNGTPDIFNREDPLTNTVSLTGNKIVAVKRIKSTQYQTGETVLLWTLDALIKGIWVSDERGFVFSTIDDQCSILSSNSIQSYDGIYYWIGAKKFHVTNGSDVQEVKNTFNRMYFFDNLNYAQKQKVWACINPEFDEIWWHFPLGNSDHCNHSVIYKVTEDSWYDTAITRVCGEYNPIFGNPLWCDSEQFNGSYRFWEHEVGLDIQLVRGEPAFPIHSFCKTGNISWCAIGPDGDWKGVDNLLRLKRIEPDIKQSGQMTITINGRSTARSQEDQNPEEKILLPSTEYITYVFQRREITITFTSNVIGGYYEMGNTLLSFDVGDTRI